MNTKALFTWVSCRGHYNQKMFWAFNPVWIYNKWIISKDFSPLLFRVVGRWDEDHESSRLCSFLTNELNRKHTTILFLTFSDVSLSLSAVSVYLYAHTDSPHPCELGTHLLCLFDHASLQHVLGTLWVDESVSGVQSLGLIHPLSGLFDVPSMLREDKGQYKGQGNLTATLHSSVRTFDARKRVCVWRMLPCKSWLL